MTKEEAYERLELEIGVDLNVVRQKFASMHNDYRMQIDNAFNPSSKRIFEQKLEELKEAYALLNESEGMDDNASLPRIAESFESLNTVEQKEFDLDEALALFKVNKNSDTALIQEVTVKHIDDLVHQKEITELLEVKEAYGKAIEKAELAKSVIDNWLKTKETVQAEVQVIESAQDLQAATVIPVQKKSNFIWYVVVGLFLLGVGFGFWWSIKEQPEIQNDTIGFVDWKPTHRISETSIGNIVLRNRELTKDELDKLASDAALNAKTYAGDLKAGDSLMIITSENGFYKVQLTNTKADEFYYLINDHNTNSFLKIIGGVNAPALNSKDSIPNSNELIASKELENQKSTEATKSDWRKNYDKIHHSSKIGYYEVELNGKYGIVNGKGLEIVPALYDRVSFSYKDRWNVILDGKYGLLNKNGQVLIPVKYESLRDHKNDLVLACINNKCGLLKVNGEEITPFKYEYHSFMTDDGFVSVRYKGKWGVINSSGQEIIPCRYTYSVDFRSGETATTYIDEKKFVFNKLGECIEGCN